MPDDTIFEFREPNNIAIDAIENSSNIITSIAIGSYYTTAYKVRDSDIILDVPDKIIAIDILGTVGPDPITFEYDIMDLDILGAKSRAQ